jgi:N-methylhydantoinase A
MTRFRIGIDIGGTFTDFVLVDEMERRIHLGKRLTTHGNYLDAVLGGIGDVLALAGIRPADIAGVVHGTTLVTNTVIERTGARTGLITTEGARDVIEIATEMRYNSFDLGIERIEPLVPRHLRLEVPERLAADGSVLKPLDLAGVPAIVETFRRAGVRSVAISLLHSYANGAHERALAEAVQACFPEAELTLSSVLVPEIREYERTSTAVVNAYVKPLASQYLREMEAQLAERGIASPLYLMLSNGGLASVDEAVSAPVRLLESGPAGGAEAACFFGRLVGEPDLISFDMGGTTAKMCLINGGAPSRSHDFEAARVHRFSKGSGLPLRIPVIDMIEIGSGGGSIAHLDQMGLLKIGPESAGSDPGPACYGLGGTLPTVTDADVVLGCLDPDFFLGGTMKLDRAKSEQAVLEHIGRPLGRDAVAAAAGIQEIVNENMATATRLHVSERGRDLRRYALLAFGGAGPVHAYRVAQLLGVKRVICPFAAGAASALGFLVAPLTVEQVRSYVAPLATLDWERLDRLYADMESAAAQALRALGVKDEEIEFTRSADMRFAGQGYEIEAPMPAGRLDASRREEVQQLFLQAYRQLFDRALANIPIEALTWRVRATGRRPEIRIEVARGASDAASALKGTRPVFYHDTRSFLEAKVYDRYRLQPGAVVAGPAVFEERESTVVVGPGARVEVDASLNLRVTLP